jgi:hypothetical protein
MLVDRPPPPPCLTVHATERAENQVLRRLGGSPHNAQVGAEVLAGEHLCLGAELDAQRLRVERFVLSADETSQLFRAQLSELPDGTTAFSFQNDTDRDLLLGVTAPVDETDYLSESELLLVPARTRVYHTFARRVGRVLVTRVKFREKPERSPAVNRRTRRGGRERVEREGVMIGGGVIAGYGVHQLDSTRLNRELAQSRYSGLGSSDALFTAALWFELGRLRLDLNFFRGSESIRSRESRDRASFVFSGGGLDVGWEFVRTRGFTLYPYVGLGFGSRAVEVPYQDQAPVLSSIEPSAPAGRTVEAGGTLMSLGVAFEQVLFTLYEDRTGYVGLSLGAKLGYHAQLGHSPWEIDEPNTDPVTFRGGPPSDVGGFYGVFSVGFPLRAAGF